MFKKIEIATRTRVDFIDITAEIERVVQEAMVEEGICFLYCPHTTAGLVLNENWDPDVEGDIAMLLARIVPDGLPYRHSEGNSTAHIKSVLLGSDHFIFVQEHHLQMGHWQGIFLAEFDGPRRRSVWIKIVRDASSG
ncbi:MAG TPA: secondary thiamine-phosphate synthase enzyme YjbQ [Anaerolineae bacterium]|nr:secondary thiamine-phosphate synthase enzyme YjbQ [Anaerolineae bacterium]HQK14895.1 secondary thiamine-phosphate synthase enzyme YjbQ [Anaerolineae bacterium]